MTSPFAEIRRHGWHFAYDEDTETVGGGPLGPTSRFGHCVDHMATSIAAVRVKVHKHRTTSQNVIASMQWL